VEGPDASGHATPQCPAERWATCVTATDLAPNEEVAMRSTARPLAVLVALALLLLLPGRAAAQHEGAIFSLGSWLGFNAVTSDGETTTMFSTSPQPGLFFFDAPGLRTAVLFPGQRVELAAALGATLISSGSSTYSVLGFDADANYAFGRGLPVRPYVGVSAGMTSMNTDGDTQIARIGAQAGIRHVVADGHGALRVEARVGRISSEEFSDGVTSYDLRLGYDLWFQ
jgi:hypothetical protein